MQFLPGQPPRDPRPHGPRRRGLRRALVACCIAAVATTAFPWSFVEASRLFGDVAGPIAARTNPGFTCVTTCLLTALLAISEGRSASSREAVRSACLVLMCAAAIVMFAHLAAGPDALRGVEARHTTWFFAASLAVALGLFVARLRMPKKRAFSGGA
jgi:hypothetical protein